jgi:hypothetical protein
MLNMCSPQYVTAQKDWSLERIMMQRKAGVPAPAAGTAFSLREGLAANSRETRSKNASQASTAEFSKPGHLHCLSVPERQIAYFGPVKKYP